jgi:hypothetical protein
MNSRQKARILQTILGAAIPSVAQAAGNIGLQSILKGIDTAREKKRDRTTTQKGLKIRSEEPGKFGLKEMKVVSNIGRPKRDRYTTRDYIRDYKKKYGSTEDKRGDSYPDLITAPGKADIRRRKKTRETFREDKKANRESIKKLIDKIKTEKETGTVDKASAKFLISQAKQDRKAGKQKSKDAKENTLDQIKAEAKQRPGKWEYVKKRYISDALDTINKTEDYEIETKKIAEMQKEAEELKKSGGGKPSFSIQEFQDQMKLKGKDPTTGKPLMLVYYKRGIPVAGGSQGADKRYQQLYKKYWNMKDADGRRKYNQTAAQEAAAIEFLNEGWSPYPRKFTRTPK